jgi:hypothetical protein
MTDQPELTRLTSDAALDKFTQAMTSAGWEPMTDAFGGSPIEWRCTCTGKVINNFAALTYYWASGSTPVKMI